MLEDHPRGTIGAAWERLAAVVRAAEDVELYVKSATLRAWSALGLAREGEVVPYPWNTLWPIAKLRLVRQRFAYDIFSTEFRREVSTKFRRDPGVRP